MKIKMPPDRFGNEYIASMEWEHRVAVMLTFGFKFTWLSGELDGCGCIEEIRTKMRFYSPVWLHPTHKQQEIATINWVTSWFLGYLYGKFGYVEV